MIKSIYSSIATALAAVAVMSVSVASLFYVYSPEPPEELMK
ncbi:cyclic lactone autoinducer peptide [Paenibacillus farraposensis]|uniref:Cyclic lactone autoinducer peptide n=1 Tax=Paenibacillus farraposensis TaxID=2807095 RepID=A0ABW4DC35_9BACL|nr:cyclic lactone autoinducer peptide [Paenibacillus farraposensis]MCC3379875.1 cyclic lactone autoinducer peptide [Paenibacillus farraposensis]